LLKEVTKNNTVRPSSVVGHLLHKEINKKRNLWTKGLVFPREKGGRNPLQGWERRAIKGGVIDDGGSGNPQHVSLLSQVHGGPQGGVEVHVPFVGGSH